jgi:iron complex outermembrane receptor protein
MRHAGKAGEALGYKISAQYYAGTDWKYRDPEEEEARRTALAGGADPGALRIGARDFDVERQAAELRLDWKPTQGTTAIFSTGYNKGDHIELTGLGAGQAEDWTYNYAQVRLLYGDWFAQVFRNWSDAGKTFLLRDGSAIVDKSSLTVFQVQHAAGLGARQRFTYGLDVLLTRPDTEGTITGNNEEDDDIDEFGLYAQSDTRLSEKLDLVLALRYDEHNRLEEAELSPRAGLVFKPGQAQTVRLTYNRAFSTPTTNNLYLDLVSRRDVFGVRASFAPIFQAQGLEFQPIDLRVQGTYRKGFDEGFTFRRGTDHRPLYRSPFAPLVAGQLSRMGLSPGSAGYSIGQDGYLALDDPVATGVMWGVGRAAVLNALTPLFEQLVAAQLQTQGQDQATAQATARQLGAGLPGVVPEQLAGLRNSLREFNIEKALAGDRAPFDPVADAFDVPRTRSTITETFELGYKAVLGRKLVVAADLYRTKTEDFGGPLGVETPNVFLDAQSVAATLGPNIAAALADPANAALAQALANLDNLRLPGLIEGNKNGSPVDELTTLFAGGAGRIPFGTVSPEQAYDPTALILTYRNFGEVSLNGLDLSLAYYATDRWTLTGNYSWVSDSFFRNVDGIADVALNAPQNKLKVGSAYAFPQWDLQVGGQVRYSGAFRQDSGVYVGKVPAHAVLDLNLVYRLPFDYGLTLALDVGNALDNRHREFVGAPKVGRLVLAQVGAAF